MADNHKIAKIFNEIADILELKEENPFRIRAYRRAAQTIESLTEDVAEISRRGDLTKIPGIGADLAGKIQEFITKGKMDFYDNLRKDIPKVLLEMMSIPNLGPKTAKTIVEHLKIKSIKELEEKARSHKLASLPGIQRKTEDNILKGIQIYKKGKERVPLGVAEPLASDIVSRLKKIKGLQQIQVCGSLRRCKETVKDIDILVTSEQPKRIMDEFVRLPMVEEVLMHGRTKSSIRVYQGLQVDLRVVEPSSFGAALMYFTGSKAHNIRIRELALKQGLKVNEYGVFDSKSNRLVCGKSEAEIFKRLGLRYIPPELREDTGEIEASIKDSLPDLIKLGDIKGDVHIHSKSSDGVNTIYELIDAAKVRGYEYIVITEHSKSLAVARGLKEKELLDQVKQIRRINKGLRGFRVLAGAEVDILDDRLDYSDEILRQLDVVVAAIHTGFKQAKEKLTKRTIMAMKNKYVHIIAHPTGRLIGERGPYQIDMEEILRVAGDTNTALEINAFPQRLDLDDINSRRAKELGVMLAIGTDAHNIDQLEVMKYGVSTARRGWLSRDNVLNTLDVDMFLKRIKK